MMAKQHRRYRVLIVCRLADSDTHYKWGPWSKVNILETSIILWLAQCSEADARTGTGQPTLMDQRLNHHAGHVMILNRL